MNNMMKQLIGKKCKIFVRNLDPLRPVFYDALIISVDDIFITFTDRFDKKTIVNMQDIIQIKSIEENE